MSENHKNKGTAKKGDGNSRGPRDLSGPSQAEEALRRSRDTATAINRLLSFSLEDVSLQKLLEKAVELILSIPWLVFKAKGAIFLLENESLALKAQNGLEEPVRKACARLPLGRCLCGRAALTGEVQYAAGIDERHEIYFEEMEPHGHYCIPIKSPEKIYGVLNLYLHEGHRRDEKEEEFLVAVSDALAGVIERKQAEEALRKSEKKFRAIFDSSQDAMYLHDLEGKIIAVNKAACERLGYSSGELEGKFLTDIVSSKDAALIAERMEKLLATGRHIFETTDVSKDGKVVPVEVIATVIEYENARAVLSISRDITGRKEAEEALSRINEELERRVEERTAELARSNEKLLRRLRELEAIGTVSSALRCEESLEQMLQALLDETLAALNTEAGGILLYHPAGGELRFAAARGWFSRLEKLLLKPGEGIGGRVFASGEAYITVELATDPLLEPKKRTLVPPGWGGACLPIRVAADTVGILFVSVPLPREITPEEVKLLTSLTEMAGTAIHRISLHEETVRRLQQLQTLRTIDAAVNASLDLRLTLNVLLENVTTSTALMEVDAAAVFLLQPHQNVLQYAAGRGFRTQTIEQTRLRLGEGCPGKAALEHRTTLVTSPAEASDEKDIAFLQAEGFASCVCLPLIAKGLVKGVLEVFWEKSCRPDNELVGFLETLAGQAAIAVDNARLFNEVQRSTLELLQAYDATIEGWAHALDLKDEETEDHSQRVTEMTVDIARHMGIKDEELAQVRRGALLHDIGKMGIPDAILLKPGKLNDDEWELMKKHPVYAFEMLSRIEYLRQALDIPYCHHEKWDGSGYPRGLKGKVIPLPARIFAVVDVYDALTSDRPYRKAWSREEALKHIKKESGSHFDPQVVEVFLKEIDNLI